MSSEGMSTALIAMSMITTSDILTFRAVSQGFPGICSTEIATLLWQLALNNWQGHGAEVDGAEVCTGGSGPRGGGGGAGCTVRGRAQHPNDTEHLPYGGPRRSERDFGYSSAQVQATKFPRSQQLLLQPQRMPIHSLYLTVPA